MTAFEHRGLLCQHCQHFPKQIIFPRLCYVDSQSSSSSSSSSVPEDHPFFFLSAPSPSHVKNVCSSQLCTQALSQWRRSQPCCPDPGNLHPDQRSLPFLCRLCVPVLDLSHLTNPFRSPKFGSPHHPQYCHARPTSFQNDRDPDNFIFPLLIFLVHFGYTHTHTHFVSILVFDLGSLLNRLFFLSRSYNFSHHLNSLGCVRRSSLPLALSYLNLSSPRLLPIRSIHTLPQPKLSPASRSPLHPHWPPLLPPPLALLVEPTQQPL